MGTGNYSATSNNMKLAHWPLMGGLLHLVQQGGDWAGPQPTQALLAVPNVTAHPSTASGPLLLSFNVPIKGLKTIYTPKRSERSIFCSKITYT